MTKKDFSVGQKVYLWPRGSNAGKRAIETTVTKVGTKYITVDFYDHKISINGFASRDYDLFISQKQMDDTLYCREMIGDIRKMMDGYSLTRGVCRYSVEQLEQIKRILGQEEEICL